MVSKTSIVRKNVLLVFISFVKQNLNNHKEELFREKEENEEDKQEYKKTFVQSVSSM